MEHTSIFDFDKSWVS